MFTAREVSLAASEEMQVPRWYMAWSRIPSFLFYDVGTFKPLLVKQHRLYVFQSLDTYTFIDFFPGSGIVPFQWESVGVYV